MFLPTSMEGTVDIFHLCCSLNNRRKLTNGMIINRQFYLLQELHRFYKKKTTIKCIPNSLNFSPLQFGVYRINIKNIIFVGMFCASLATDLKYQKVTRNILKRWCHKNYRQSRYFKDWNILWQRSVSLHNLLSVDTK